MLTKKNNDNKLIGIIAILFGAFGLIIFLLIGINKFIDRSSDIFLVRYFTVIGLINGCIYFIVYGLAQFYGFIAPYYSKNKTEINRAKNNVLGGLLITPILISGTVTILAESGSISGKILWAIFLVYISFLILSGVITITKKKEATRGARR